MKSRYLAVWLAAAFVALIASCTAGKDPEAPQPKCTTSTAVDTITVEHRVITICINAHH